MDRINGAGTTDIGGGRRGFRDENLGLGIEGTEVTALWANMLQEEIVKVIEDAGLVLNPADWTQLSQALALKFSSRSGKGWIAVLSMTTTAPPGAPASGDTYLLPTGSTGAWAGKDGMIAEWLGLSWSFTAPKNGHGISLPDGRVFERIAGAYVEKIALDSQSSKWRYAVAGGTSNALTAALTPTPPALTAGMKARLLVAAANTGAATLNLNGLGAVSIYRPFDNSLSAGDIGIGINELIYDGTYWRLMAPANVVSGSPASRWTKFSNGLIMQWGGLGTSTGGPVTVTFPIAFPTALTSVVVSDESSPIVSSQMSVFGVGNKTTSSFQVSATKDFSTAVADSGLWIAMGY